MSLEFTGQPTEVLVLGSQHLDERTPDTALALTLKRLIAWAPGVVALEIHPGELIDSYLREGNGDPRYGGMPLAPALGAQAQAHSGWTRPQAARVAADPATEPSQRVLAYLAAYEPWTALLHWTPDLTLPDDLSAAMNELARSPSERVRLGVNVARALGHRQLALFDDHTSVDLAELWPVILADYETPEFQAMLAAHPGMVTAEPQAGDYWPTLRHLNSPEAVALSADLESGLLLRMPQHPAAHRARLAGWDTRNLFMAARLRLATTLHAGGRVLAVVGHAHKGPLEAALTALGADLRMVGLEELE